MRINGFTGVSLIDYPGKICSIVYTSPCNFKCPFCHNVSLITVNPDTLSEEDILEDISDRRLFIDAVTVTGGEPFMQRDLSSFLAKIKSFGLLSKVDTNGYEPGKLAKLISEGLIDYAAMDIKAPLNFYDVASGVAADTSRIKDSIDIIMNSGIDYCFRTTVVPGIIDGKSLEKIGRLIKGAKFFVIQQYENTMTLDRSYEKIKPYGEEQLAGFSRIMEKYAEKVRTANTALVS
ncbi:MAG TPA: anaerobic ribonucleoside-triphosphate reductase activating protein [bacterium]|nr:anaerobic ribonucleoside-triphosphate reductase activating protein [bacterium]